MFKKYFTFSNLTLLTALSLSSIAAWFAIVGLVAIFPAKATEIIVFGAAIEIGKIVATVWLRKYWEWCGWQFKLLLTPLIAILMLLTSMGTFGFLSAAHSQQSLASGDSVAKLAVLDERIKTQRENIELARRALEQLNAQVDARLNRGDSEAGAERAVQIRRSQAGERAKLQGEIGAAQLQIAKLNEERAPFAAEVRKVEAEVGPIKYIAALVYGDNPDANVLERAVRWVIILLVIVLDPLAIALVLAGNSSRKWDAKIAATPLVVESQSAPVAVVSPAQSESVAPSSVETPITPWPNVWTVHEQETPLQDNKTETQEKHTDRVYDPVRWPYLDAGGPGFKNDVPPQVYRPLASSSDESSSTHKDEQPLKESHISVDANVGTIDVSVDNDAPITEGITSEREHISDFEQITPGYVNYKGKAMSIEALRGLQPELFTIKPDTEEINVSFGTQFPQWARRGDTFVRVDMMPNRVFKFDGDRWREMQKESSDTYIQDRTYLQYLIQKIDSGEYDIELLTDIERQQISDYLSAQKS